MPAASAQIESVTSPSSDERQAEHEDLQPGVPGVGVDELGQEGEEEERGLRVEDVHHHALGEVAAAAARRPLRIGVGWIGAPEQRPDPEHDQVRRAERFTTVNAVADDTRIAESPTVAAARWTSVPTWIPSTEASPAPRPWWMLRVTM